MIVFKKIGDIAKRICTCFMQHGQIREEDFDLYVYGFREGIILSINLSIWLIVGGLFGQFWENAVFLFIYWFLRRYAGGYHANSREKCFIYSMLLILVNMTMLRIVSISRDIGVLMLSIALFITWVCSPVESLKNHMEEEQKKKFRMMSRGIGLAAAGLVVILYQVFCNKYAQSIMWGICSVSFLQVAALIQRKRWRKKHDET